jgi:hypothetical protein
MSNNYHEEKGSSFGTNGFQMVGIMNALKNSDVYVDMMIIAMCIPFILKMVFGGLRKIKDLLDMEEWIDWWNGWIREHECKLIFL